MSTATNARIGAGDWASEVSEWVILTSRYLLVPLYLALLFGILTITVDFYLLLTGATQEAMLIEHTLKELELLDITMIANLIWLISAGSYYVFIDKNYDSPKRKRPRCLAHISTGILKEKMAGSLIGVSSIHLLKIFLHVYSSVEPVQWQKIGVLAIIHVLFILGLLAFNYSNSADHHTHNQEKKKEKEEHEIAH